MILAQIRAQSQGNTTLGKYIRAHLAAKAKHGYLPFATGCWDVPTWATRLMPYMKHPNFRLFDTWESIPDNIVLGSVMEANRNHWKYLTISQPNTHFYLGGYCQPIGGPNVTWFDTIEGGIATIAYLQGEPRPKIYNSRAYPRNGPVLNGVRLQLSTGCNHQCTFCTVPHPAVKNSISSIYDQLMPLYSREVGVVYMDDKTFGQCDWDYIATINDWIHPAGFVVQTTATQIVKMGMDTMREWQRMGVIAVEIGVESYNNSILRIYRKPATESLIDVATHMVARAGMLVCPNIIVGLDGEAPDTYDQTSDWMKRVPNLGWFNMFCLADYESSGQDASEETPIKSWQSPAAQVYAGYGFQRLYDTAIASMS